MELMLKLEPKKNALQFNYNENIMLIGSCFTEHIGNYLISHKFSVLQNPNGILFDILSVCRTLNNAICNKKYKENDLFYHNELWQSWEHHSMFSGMDKNVVLDKINTASNAAHLFLKKTDWLIITLGSSYAYKLNKETAKEYAINNFVANCHKAPPNWFEKQLIPIEEQIHNLQSTIDALKEFNPTLKIIFTISPVRHIRDGVVENNRSKARLIETVNQLCSSNENTFYFAAYELVIDVLRDYRFYDIDLVHPNYTATNMVVQHFLKSFANDASLQLLEKIKPIIIARKHKAFNPNSIAHKKFMAQQVDLINVLIKENPFLQLDEELQHFSNFEI
jgi:hypothetical protein